MSSCIFISDAYSSVMHIHQGGGDFKNLVPTINLCESRVLGIRVAL